LHAPRPGSGDRPNDLAAPDPARGSVPRVLRNVRESARGRLGVARFARLPHRQRPAAIPAAVADSLSGRLLPGGNTAVDKIFPSSPTTAVTKPRS